MMIQEKEYQKVGKNNLHVPMHLVNSIISLKYIQTLKIKIKRPFNFLYTFWKPSHFFTGLEVHSGTCSWRTFRLSKNTYTATKMYEDNDFLVVEIFANKELSSDIISHLEEHIVYSYGLNENYEIPERLIVLNKYVNELFPKLRGTRISCPESIFEISVISLLLQNTNISRTSSMFRKLIEQYGKLVIFDDVVLFTFYSPEDILLVLEDELKEKCRLGYRAKYFKNYADFFSKNRETELRRLTKSDLLNSLETIKGVGPYTSNIVAASALRDRKAIPLDAWNRKILASGLYSIDYLEKGDLLKRITSDFEEYSGLIAMYVIEYEYLDKPVVPLISL